MITLDLSDAELALLLANEHNDHPGWAEIARKIHAAQPGTEPEPAPGRADELLTEYRLHVSIASRYRRRAHQLEEAGLDREEGTLEEMTLTALHEASDTALGDAADAAENLISHMLTTGQLPTALSQSRPELTAAELAVIAGLLAPQEDIESDAITPGPGVLEGLRAKFPSRWFYRWAAAAPGRYALSLPSEAELAETESGSS